MSRAQRFHDEPVSTPAAVKVDHPLTIAADQPSASRPSFAELAGTILRSRKSAAGLGGVHMAAIGSSHLLPNASAHGPSVAAVAVVTVAAVVVVTRAGGR